MGGHEGSWHHGIMLISAHGKAYLLINAHKQLRVLTSTSEHEHSWALLISNKFQEQPSLCMSTQEQEHAVIALNNLMNTHKHT